MVMGCSESGALKDQKLDPTDPLVLIDWYDGPDRWVDFLDLAISKDQKTAYLCSNIRGIISVDISDATDLKAKWCAGSTAGQPEAKPFVYQSACEHLVPVEMLADTSLPTHEDLLITHRGHEYMPNPYLAWIRLPELEPNPLQEVPIYIVDYVYEPGVYFHGLDTDQGHVVVATGKEGFRVFALEKNGLIMRSANDDANNALDVEIRNQVAFIADGGFGIRSYDLSDMENPTALGVLALEGTSQKILWARDALLVVAAGSTGLHLIDVSDPSSPQIISSVSTGNSVVDLTLHDDTLYAAAWTELMAFNITDPANPIILGGEKGRSSGAFPRYLAVAHTDSHLFAAEWNLLESFVHQKDVFAPDIRLPSSEILFSEGDTSEQSRSLRIDNIGTDPLTVTVQAASDESCSAFPATLEIQPGQTQFMEIACASLPPSTHQPLTLSTNDPDEEEVTITIRTADQGKSIGDPFPPSVFESYQDGTQVESQSLLEGKVTVLFYFATM